jgi:hypothetical protein
MRVSSKSKTKVYVFPIYSSSKGAKNGGLTLGKFGKLLGNVAVYVFIADAFNTVKGFFPVNEFPPAPTKFEVPEVLVLLLIPFYNPPFP